MSRNDTSRAAPPQRDRRRFLVGSGGAALALPLLPSLFSAREAQAQAAGGKNFVHMFSWHGGIQKVNMFPPDATLTETRSYAGISIRRGALAPQVANGETRLSDVLRAPSAQFTPGLLAKMNVLNGLCVPFYSGHNSGVMLGNFGDASGLGELAPTAKEAGQRQTIDQLMAWSPSFYADMSKVRQRSVAVTDSTSWGHSNPLLRQGPITRLPAVAGGVVNGTNLNLFDHLFGTTTAPTRPLIVDRVLENYRALRNGTAALSAEDRRRLDDHMQRVFELQRKLQAASAAVARPTVDSGSFVGAGYNINAGNQARFGELNNDVIVAALAAGVCRVVTTAPMRDLQTYSTYGGDWHQDIAHRPLSDAARSRIMIDSYQMYFQRGVLDLARKLDAVAGPLGGTLLDSTLLAWTHECGNSTHNGQAVPVITFGSAQGFLRTGQYCDYRDLARWLIEYTPAEERNFMGLLWHQWLGTALQAMGLPKSEYERPAVCGGYPDFKYDSSPDWYRPRDALPPYPSAIWAVTGEVLPWLRA